LPNTKRPSKLVFIFLESQQKCTLTRS
jgi:hypothetical protein